MSKLTVRAYNVLFGDAVLVSVPDRDPQTGIETERHILIDVGNVLAGEGGRDDVFMPVVADIRRRLNGRPLDLYVMTHEHMDHIQGLPYAAKKGVELEVDYSWLTASSGPGYYTRYPEARSKRLMLESAYFAIERHLMANPGASTPWFSALMLNNNPYRTKSCVEYLSKLAGKHTRYVHRRTKLRRGVHHPFREAALKILAPEQDTSAYYGKLRPLVVPEAEEGAASPPPDRLSAPAGVDAAAFQRLMDSWDAGISSSALAIDKAANNTSVVFVLAWRGWRLLFAGDAEQRSWQMMARADVLEPVHFLKVGHHGSHNATPADPILDRILPVKNTTGRARTALVSTCGGTYGGVPHGPTLARIETRCDQVLVTDSVDPGASIGISFAS